MSQRRLPRLVFRLSDVPTGARGIAGFGRRLACSSQPKRRNARGDQHRRGGDELCGPQRLADDEALAMELPVVSTQHSGIPEVIENDVNGLLVPVADAPALANAMAKILKDPELGRTFGKRGRKKVLDGFSIESNVGQLLQEFKAVVGEG